MMSCAKDGFKHFPSIESPVKDNQSRRDLGANPLQYRPTVVPMGLGTYQVHPHRKQNRLCHGGTKQPQRAKLMTEVKLRLIGVALLVAMISEEMESKLLLPGLYRSGLVVNVDPVVKPLL